MATLLIAGHGPQRNGTFDPGATGFISKGEHKYFVENFFPAMRKYLPKDSGVVLWNDHKVSNYGDLAKVANSFGKDTTVVELHYDASSSESASKGHVIVHEAYAPDALDLKLRDVIAKHIGVRYEHKGHKGIAGRNNLKNVNDAKRNGINYRLVEVGFGTNKGDADKMIKNVDAIAKDFVIALVGKVAENKPAAPTAGSRIHKVVKNENLWVIARKYNVTIESLKRWNGLKSDLIKPGQELAVSPVMKVYTVKAGDSLSKIGRDLGLVWQKLAADNNIKSPYVLQLGQKLKY